MLSTLLRHTIVCVRCEIRISQAGSRFLMVLPDLFQARLESGAEYGVRAERAQCRGVVVCINLCIFITLP